MFNRIYKQGDRDLDHEDANGWTYWCKKIKEFFSNGVQPPLEMSGEQLRDPRIFPRTWTGIIVATGPGTPPQAAYKDCRYWVKRAFCSNIAGGGSAGTPVGFVPYTINVGPLYRHVEATNIAEIQAQTHNLRVDSVVEVTEVWDRQTPAEVRYTFDRPAEAFTAIITGSVSYGTAVLGKPVMWKYSWTPLIADTTGAWTSVGAGVGGTSNAYNQMEGYNDSTMTGVGVKTGTQGDPPCTLTLLPIPNNRVVVEMTEMAMGFRFSAPNPVKVECTV